MSRKFDVIIESYMQRYQGTNFLIGDRILFNDNYLQHEWTKKLPVVALERLKAIIECGDNIRVTAVKPLRPATAQMGSFTMVDDIYLDIAREQAPGLFTGVFTIPQELVTLQEDYPNLAGKTPPGQIKEDPSHIKPKEVKLPEEEVNFDMKRQTHGSDHDARELPVKNERLPNSNEPKTGESYTKQYMDQHPYSRVRGDRS
jgi:hypothetical protein